MSWGIRPAALAPEGWGTLAAAVTAEVISLEDALHAAALGGDPAALLNHLCKLRFSAPSIPFTSATGANLADPRYWLDQLLHPRINSSAAADARHLVEVGLPASGVVDESMLSGLGRLWCAGVAVDWPALHAAKPRYRVPLPTYPFERQRYWLD